MLCDSVLNSQSLTCSVQLQANESVFPPAQHSLPQNTVEPSITTVQQRILTCRWTSPASTALVPIVVVVEGQEAVIINVLGYLLAALETFHPINH